MIAEAILLGGLGALVAGGLRSGTRRGSRSKRGARRTRTWPPKRSRLVRAWNSTGGPPAPSEQLADNVAVLSGKAAGAGFRLSRRAAKAVSAASQRRWNAAPALQRRRGRTTVPVFWRVPPAEAPGNPEPAGDDGGNNPQPPSFGQPDQPATPAPPPAEPSSPSAPEGAERSHPPMSRFLINLEPPATDAEFLESCVDLGDMLRSLAEQVSEWADGLSSMALPSSVTNPLNSIGDGIGDAASGASRAAQAFADEFEDAREVASRGMKFTGRDAA